MIRLVTYPLRLLLWVLLLPTLLLVWAVGLVHGMLQALERRHWQDLKPPKAER